jgi:hypothetical protein
LPEPVLKAKKSLFPPPHIQSSPAPPFSVSLPPVIEPGVAGS